MLAEIRKSDDGSTARFVRHWNHSVEQVWAMLTDNEQLPKWFPELRTGELREGGFMTFDMGNDEILKMAITDFRVNSVLEYEWDADVVRFELTPISEGCQLVLEERLDKITDHTPRDLAGWHVCLDVIEALLAGRQFGDRKEAWKQWYEKYVQAIDAINGSRTRTVRTH